MRIEIQATEGSRRTHEVAEQLRAAADIVDSLVKLGKRPAVVATIVVSLTDDGVDDGVESKSL